MSIERYHILLTACIAPEQRPELYRSDASLRLSDYEVALAEYLRLKDPSLASVTFLDNSGHSLKSLEAVARRYGRDGLAVEFHSLQPTALPAGVGYGYAELAMLDWAQSQLGLFRGDEVLVKATGRLCFPALPRLMHSLPPDVSFVADAVNRQLPSRRTGENGVVRTQLLAFRPAFYRQQLAGLKEQMRAEAGHRLIESVLYRAVWPYRNEASVLLRFPVNCSPVGLAAHKNKDYASPIERLRDSARQVTRSVAPWIWI